MCEGEGQERVLAPRNLSNGEGQVEPDLDESIKAMRSYISLSVKSYLKMKMKGGLIT